MLTFVEAQQPEVTEHFHGLMIDRGAFDRMLAHEAALERRRLPLRRDGAVDRCRRHGHNFGRRPLAAARPDRRRRPALARRRGDRRRSTAISSIRGRSRCRSVLPHDATDIFLSADYRGGYGWLFPKGAVANVGLGVAVESRRLLKPMLAALCAEARGRAPHRHEGLCSHRRRHSGRRALAIRRTPRAHRRAARGRCRRPHQSGDRRRHRLGGAIGRARRARGGGFSCGARRRARRVTRKSSATFSTPRLTARCGAGATCWPAMRMAAGPTRAR